MVTVQSPWRALLGELVDGTVMRRLAAAGAVTIIAFIASVSPLALAGWYIAASAVADLAAASAFSFLYPTAAVRAPAVARTLGRYFERISSHAVTLDVASRLRTRLFARALRCRGTRWRRCEAASCSAGSPSTSTQWSKRSRAWRFPRPSS
jgi:ABC-type transport system involved in cytochrome bd biosynthesis fused ATPase/permease subunit